MTRFQKLVFSVTILYALASLTAMLQAAWYAARGNHPGTFIALLNALVSYLIGAVLYRYGQRVGSFLP